MSLRPVPVDTIGGVLECQTEVRVRCCRNILAGGRALGFENLLGGLPFAVLLFAKGGSL
jgi:hypothetical protein